jgi:hypothetical protein
MKVWFSIDHDFFYPVGCCSIVVASTYQRAKELLDEKLMSHGLAPFVAKPYTLHEIKCSSEFAEILLDGDY